MPPALVEEMRGLADGAKAANPSSPATFARVAALNYGYDMLLALIFAGEILDLLGRKAALAGAAPPSLASLRAVPLRAWRPPAFCNAFMAGGAAVRGGGGLMARDFMFALAEVFQDIAAPIIYVPADATQLPLVSVAAPGFVGSMAALNSAGFMMGVDVLQAAAANTTLVGLNSLLMVRAVAHGANSTAQALGMVRGAARGVPWIYPMNDAAGAGLVLETLPSPPGGAANTTWPDFRHLVGDAALRALLPSPEALRQLLAPAEVDFAGGVWARSGRAPLRPEDALIPALNPALLAHGRTAWNASAWAPVPGDFVWRNFRAEEAAFSGGLSQSYFSPERAARGDIVVATNLALAPPLRIAAMSFWAALEGMGAPQYRYDALSAEVAAALAGAPDGLTADDAMRVIQFLSRVPGYYEEKVEGVMAVGELNSSWPVLHTKSGYWVDNWLTTTLQRYLSPPSPQVVGAAALPIRAADVSALAVLDCAMACNKYRASAASPPEDALRIFARAGFNTVRLRVWVNPLANHSEGNSTYVAALAARAAAAGLSVWVDFHLSDWWADPGHQAKPAAWAQLPFAGLVDAVAAHVRAVLRQVTAASPVRVSMVQVGNEITPGALWPLPGQPCGDSGRVDAPCEANWAQLGALIGAGITAAREAVPGVAVAVHTDLGNRGAHAAESAVWFYTAFAKALPPGVDYDVIALSYYMRWTALGPAGEAPIAAALKTAFPTKRLVLAETSYPWAGTAAPGPWSPTQQGQLEFWRATLGNASDAGIEGVAWWGGEYAGDWTALFDGDFVALPALLNGWAP